MPALAHQDARLKSPFHGKYSVDRVLSRQGECGAVYIGSFRASQRHAKDRPASRNHGKVTSAPWYGLEQTSWAPVGTQSGLEKDVGWLNG